MQSAKPRVLVVEDDDATRLALTVALREDAEVTGAIDVAQGVRFVATTRPDVIVLDLFLDAPGAEPNGHEILDRLRVRGMPVPPVIVVSGWPGGAEIAQRIGAAAYSAS